MSRQKMHGLLALALATTLGASGCATSGGGGAGTSTGDSTLPSTAAAFAAFDVTALCARIEGLLPLMLVESMAAGIPVVTTDVGGIAQCLRDGIDAAVVRKVPDDEGEPTRDVLSAFEARLRRLVLDPSERARLGAAGRQRARALVKANDFHRDFLAAVDLALSRRSSRR